MIAAPPSARQARKWLRDRRSERVRVRQRVLRVGDALIYAGMVGGLAIGAARAGLERAGLERAADPVLVRWVVVAAVVLVLAGAAKTLLALGPVLVRPAMRTWLLSAPIDRRQLLRGRFAGLLILGAVGGAAVGVAALVAAGTRGGWGWWIAAGGAFGVLESGLAVLVQSWPRRVRDAQRALTVIMAAAVAGVTVLVWAVPPWPGVDAVPLAFGLGAAAVAAVWWAARRLGGLSRASVAGGVELAETAAVATTFLDPTVLSGTLLVRRTRAIARVRSARIRGGRAIALLRADFARVRRLWVGAAMWAALLPVPYALAPVVPVALLPAVHVIVAFLAVDRLAGGLRLVCRSTAIRRAVGGDDRELRVVHLIIPGVGAALWCAVTAAALPAAPVAVVAISAVGAVAVSYRIATRPPMDYSSALVDLGFGPVPIGLIVQLARGPALLAVLAGVQVLIAS